MTNRLSAWRIFSSSAGWAGQKNGLKHIKAARSGNADVFFIIFRLPIHSREFPPD
jgi:hypothetical protein